ncbi:rRNA maturation RNase YbeY [Tenuibacillus multivorans]|uniref:Endoribonuclease YbeY n=1 Tax=Tenuibacillus multivorans TaxID=237069 RepID=A0A1G9ZFF7_9BACI|nr:rRNA maturation RNase YbeY [Tenuibacillus multivorans]GEL78313.1 endoribonuclease YbeY [Tenuibacillus multivorans]SDN19193.1 probable rRNA maturation factor [Tenuibacillus multivorans]
MIIDITDETNQTTDEQSELLKQLLDYAGRMEMVNEAAELSVTLVQNETIQEINRDYRGKDKPTDVISFALEEQGENELDIVGEDLPEHLGDIIVSVEQAQDQAEEYGHSFNRELGFLVVHGFLHLLGYDHQTVEEEKEMFERQEHILQEFGLKRNEIR